MHFLSAIDSINLRNILIFFQGKAKELLALTQGFRLALVKMSMWYVFLIQHFTMLCLGFFSSQLVFTKCLDFNCSTSTG